MIVFATSVLLIFGFDILSCFQELEHGEFVRVRTVHLNGKPRVLTLKQDLHYWPTWELKFNPETATWHRRVIKALDSTFDLIFGANLDQSSIQLRDEWPILIRELPCTRVHYDTQLGGACKILRNRFGVSPQRQRLHCIVESDFSPE